MNHIYKVSEWESAGKWLCGDISALAADSNKWWYPCNILEISPVEYVELLIKKFHAVDLRYSVKGDVLMFSFPTLELCRKYKNFINKKAREKRFVTYQF